MTGITESLEDVIGYFAKGFEHKVTTQVKTHLIEKELNAIIDDKIKNGDKKVKLQKHKFARFNFLMKKLAKESKFKRLFDYSRVYFLLVIAGGLLLL